MAAVVGGALWIGATLLHASKPRGCVGGECAYRAMRQSGPIDAALVLLSLFLLTAGVSGLVKLARSTGRFGQLGNTGAALAGAGAAVIVV